MAARLRARRFDAALILPNSFSSALIAALTRAPVRIGYARDARAPLLTHPLHAPRRRDLAPFSESRTNPGAWAPVPALDYYHAIAARFLDTLRIPAPPPGPLELATTPSEERAASELLLRAGLDPESERDAPLVLLNPGGNDPAKRWPIDRFAAVADALARDHRARILISGSPAEAPLTAALRDRCADPHRTLNLGPLGLTLGSLKAVLRRCDLMITNDTGPRHIAAAFGVPVITLFGPTDHRWTTIPHALESIVLADPTLPAPEIANDHPARCAIDRIAASEVLARAVPLLSAARRDRPPIKNGRP
jgi:heptosyltransferase-2